MRDVVCFRHMRTTLNVDDELMKRTRQLAKRRGKTLTEVFEAALREHLAQADHPTTEYELELPVFEGTAPPLVDLADRAALYEAMEADVDRRRYERPGLRSPR